MKYFTMLVFAASFIAFSPSVSAVTVEDCDKINDLANLWNEVANLADEGGEGSAELEKAAEDLSLVTLAMAQTLKGGNKREKSAGKSIETQFKALVNAKTSQVVAKIDALVKSIDNLTDFCDEISN